jgi:transposase-like protein
MCPRCHSTDTQPDLSADSYAKGLLNQWRCNTCGYTGLVFPEYPIEEIEKQKNRK